MCALARKVLKNENGVVAIMVAILLVALVGFVALVVDVGALYERRRQVQTAADGAALSGAQELPDQTNATQVAIEYLNKNTVPDGKPENIAFPNSYTIKVTAPREPVTFFFAPVLGITGSTVSATATARVVNLDRFVPWGVVLISLTSGQFTGTEDVTLKFGAGGQTTGNFQSITIPRTDTTGAGPTYEKNIALGTEGVLEAGQVYNTFPGNRPSELTQGLIIGNPPSYSGLLAQVHDSHTASFDPPGSTSVTIDNCPINEVFDFVPGTTNVVTRIKEPSCPRLVKVPIIGDWPAGDKPVAILDFRYFYIMTPPPPNSGQIFEVTGKLLDLQGNTRPRRIELIE